MTDLVQRLRNPSSYTNWATADAYMREAADEIERLRAALAAHAAPGVAVAEVRTVHYGGPHPAAITAVLLCDTVDYWELPVREGSKLYAAPTAAQPVAPLSDAFEDECARTDSLLTILGLDPWRCRTEGGSLMPRKVLEQMAEKRAAVADDHLRAALQWIAGATTQTPGLTDAQLGKLLAGIKACAEGALSVAQADPRAAQAVAPLRRGVNGVCTRSICECERQGLGDQCVWLAAAQADTKGGA